MDTRERGRKGYTPSSFNFGFRHRLFSTPHKNIKLIERKLYQCVQMALIRESISISVSLDFDRFTSVASVVFYRILLLTVNCGVKSVCFWKKEIRYLEDSDPMLLK